MADLLRARHSNSWRVVGTLMLLLAMEASALEDDRPVARLGLIGVWESSLEGERHKGLPRDGRHYWRGGILWVAICSAPRHGPDFLDGISFAIADLSKPEMPASPIAFMRRPPRLALTTEKEWLHPAWYMWPDLVPGRYQLRVILPKDLDFRVPKTDTGYVFQVHEPRDDEDRLEILFRSAEAFLEVERPEEAEPLCLRFARAVGPEKLAAHELLRRLYELQGRKEMAFEFLKQQIRMLAGGLGLSNSLAMLSPQFARLAIANGEAGSREEASKQLWDFWDTGRRGGDTGELPDEYGREAFGDAWASKGRGWIPWTIVGISVVGALVALVVLMRRRRTARTPAL